jgi:hypothetical protein
MDKNAPALVELSLDDCYRGDQMLEYVSVLHIIQGNLVVEEGLHSRSLRYRLV